MRSLTRIVWSYRSRRYGLAVRRYARQLHHSSHQRRHHVPLGRDQLAHAHQPALHAEQLCQLVIARLGEDLLLKRVDLIVKVRQSRKEAVDQGVRDVVQQDKPHRPAGPGGQAARLAQPLPEGVQRVAVILPDGDQEVLGDEDVDLGEIVPALPGDTVVHQVNDVPEVLHLGSLAEITDRLDGQRVELEDVAQQGDAVRIGRLEVKPEDRAVRQRALDRRLIERSRGTIDQDELSVHGNIVPNPERGYDDMTLLAIDQTRQNVRANTTLIQAAVPSTAGRRDRQTPGVRRPSSPCRFPMSGAPACL